MLPNRVIAAALEAQAFCEQHGWHFCIIGGLAVHRWGEPRLTVDVDVTLLTGLGSEETYVDEWLKHFPSRPPCTREFAMRHRVLLLLAGNGVGLDVALGALDFEARSVARSSAWLSPDGHRLRTCSAEDLIVHKCIASRGKDWVDAEGVLIRQWGKLDLALVRRELRPLAELKEEPEILDRLERLLAKLGRSPTLSRLRTPDAVEIG